MSLKNFFVPMIGFTIGWSIVGLIKDFNKNLPVSVINSANGKCDGNEGLKSLEHLTALRSVSIKVVCNNGAVFEINHKE